MDGKLRLHSMVLRTMEFQLGKAVASAILSQVCEKMNTTTLDGVCYKREMRCARSGDAILVTHYELSARSA